MEKILLTWLGLADYGASGVYKSPIQAKIYKNELDRGIINEGPILKSLIERYFSKVYILSYIKKLDELEDSSNIIQPNTKEGDIQFQNWLQSQLKIHNKNTKIKLCPVWLKNQNDSERIYKHAKNILDKICKERKNVKNFDITFNITPGTQVMGVIWSSLALSKPEENIKIISMSDKYKGIEDVKLPFILNCIYEIEYF